MVAVDAEGTREVVLEIDAFPFSIDWLLDGRLVVVGNGLIQRREVDGSLTTHADLRDLSGYAWNEIVVDGRGNIYVNNIGFDMMHGEAPRPGTVALVRPDGTVTTVADDLQFPNGMAVTDDNSTLIVAESYAGRLTAFDITADGTLTNRRVWARSRAAHRTGSVSTRRVRCGSPTYRTDDACACAKAARSSTLSMPTAAASPACSVAPTARRCSSWPRSGVVPMPWTTRVRVRCSPPPRPSPVPAAHSGTERDDFRGRLRSTPQSRSIRAREEP